MKLSDYNHVFIDVDETLFSHKLYTGWLAQYLSAKFGIDTSEYLTSFNEYHDVQDQKGLLRLYRHEDHLLDKTGLSWTMLSGEIESAVKSNGKDFCYSDAHNFLDKVKQIQGVEVRLLTYGSGSYQRFKIGLCPYLNLLPVHVVREPKGEFLRKNYYDQDIRGILIDDKAPLIMPNNWQHIWINRNKLIKPNQAKCIEITGLDAVPLHI